MSQAHQQLVSLSSNPEFISELEKVIGEYFDIGVEGLSGIFKEPTFFFFFGPGLVYDGLCYTLGEPDRDIYESYINNDLFLQAVRTVFARYGLSENLITEDFYSPEPQSPFVLKIPVGLRKESTP